MSNLYCFSLIVYSLSKSPLDIMDELNRKSDKPYFELLTEISEVPTEENAFTTWIKLGDIVSFTGNGPTRDDSHDNAVKKAYYYLKSLSSLITKFRSIYAVTHNPLYVMRELIPKHRDLIKSRTMPYGSM